MTETRREVVKTTEIAGKGKDGKESKGEYSNLIRIPCIRYSITFRKKSVPILALLDLSSEVNAIYPTSAWELGLPIRITNIETPKIDGTMLDSFGMVITAFSVTDEANWVRFFEKTFLVANVSLKIVFGMLFFTLSGVDVNFLDWELRWKTYTTKEVLPTTRRIKLVGKKEFAAVVLDPKSEIFVVHIISLSFNALPSSSLFELDSHPSRRP